jgi:LAS superfamily LD-carboxypeptidase LdcB
MEYGRLEDTRGRRNRKRIVGNVLMLAGILLMGAHIYTVAAVHKVEPKSYYYKEDSNVVAVDVTTIKVEHPSVLLVNKDHALPTDYVPSDLVEPDVAFAASAAEERRKMDRTAATALEELFAAGEADGVHLVGVSGFRSYATQNALYYRSLRRNGYAYASIYSAQAGKSEHQTGLAIDLSCAQLGNQLYTRFCETPEGIWLAEHCTEYGFIIRYPKDKTDITGYAYEPWHIRYVGVTVAQYLKANDLTLDEYVGAQDYETYYNLQ